MAGMNDTRHSARGMALVLLAAMLWGTTGTAQSLAPATLSPYWVGALRLVIGSAFFAVSIETGSGYGRVSYSAFFLHK